MQLSWSDGDFQLLGDTIRATPNSSTNGSGGLVFQGFYTQLQFQISHYSPTNQDGPVRFTTNLGFTLCSDIDNDGVPSIYDLDSDNDGIFDLYEAGHGQADLNNDGTIDGAPASFGANGLYDAVETIADNGVLAYTIANSETILDSTVDAYDTDADGDGCNDTEEENIPDPDDNGIAGTGTPTVNSQGLVTTITYGAPVNNSWQNPAVGPCVAEVCDDGIDNDLDGLIDCADSDCMPAISFSLVTDIACEGTTSVPLSGGSPTGGSYSGIGVSGNTFDASVAGLGVHLITYTITDGNGCTNTATDNITVEPLPTTSLQLSDSLVCGGAGMITLDGETPAGGTFSGTGVSGSTFNAGLAGVGTHPIEYTYVDVNGCEATAVDSITVLIPPSVSLVLSDDIDCINNTSLILSGGVPTGGTYTGTGVTGGVFNASTAGLGVHTITYTFVDVNGCTGTASDDLTVVDLPSVSLTLTNDLDCVTNSSLTLDGGTPSGGTFSGVGVSGNNFDASVAGVGVHQITYSYTDGNGCTNTAADDITVDPPPSVALQLLDSLTCEGASVLELRGGSPSGGTYSGTGVIGTNFDATITGTGTFPVTYTYTDGNGCTASAVDSVTVLDAPNISLVLSDDEECINNTVLTLDGGTPMGGGLFRNWSKWWQF